MVEVLGGRPLAHVSLLMAFSQSASCILRESLTPVPKGKYCVYWPPSLPEKLPELSTSQGKKKIKLQKNNMMLFTNLF